MQNKKSVRSFMRKQRLALSDTEKTHASCNLLATTCKQLWFLNANNIALYLASDGEISPKLIQQEIWQRKKNCFLPALHPWKKRALQFAQVTPTSLLINNRFNIPEPAKRTWVPFNPKHLDVVLLPLVAFDRNGSRLGMGGGFYDKAFAFKKHSNAWRRPLFIGLAYSFQEVELLDIDPWDIPLDGILTEKEFHTF